ncbi:MAG: glycosyltransferase [Sphingomonas sp.]|nr:glycosyltransferase [Sphingomonas sp.]
MNQDDPLVCRIYVDVRCLQDERFRNRGVGQHVASVLSGALDFSPTGPALELVACVDRSMPPLEDQHRLLFRGEQAIGAPMAPGSILLQSSPMTHPQHALRNALADPTIRSVAIVYDFIPLEFPNNYLADATIRKEYLNNLAILSDYDRFISISEFTSRELQGTLGILPRVCHVSGVAVRDSVIRYSGSHPTNARYCLVIGGGDKRKNVELPICAHASSTRLNSLKVELKIVGNYSEDAIDSLRALHLRKDGEPDLLQFIEGVSDADLASLYQNALLTVCPSRAEGFSIPVVEANANGCPVIISDCDAQTELMPLPEYQFHPDDAGRVRALMESFLDPRASARALAQQGSFWTRFDIAAVQQRFWTALFAPPSEERASVATGERGAVSPHVARELKPRLAIASPVPPDRSGVADYTMATMTALAKYAKLDLYTETQGRIANRAFVTIQPLSTEPYTNRNYDGVISVLGNSHLHLETFKLLLNYGGSSIAHDARMLHFYVALLGDDRAKAVASRELGRAVTSDDIQGWIANQRSMPILFLSEILEASQQTFVHSPTTKDIVKNLYGRETVHLPFATYRAQLPEFVGQLGRVRARELLGYSKSVRLLICLGDLIADKALEECLWTASVLDGWGVPIRLAFVGNSHPDTTAYLQSVADILGIGDKIRFSQGMVDERTYQAYLAAADAAIQLRIYKFGGLSGAMLDGIAAGLPTIANAHLAEAMESPSYVKRIPDGLSPILAAEKLMEIFESDGRDSFEDERRAFLQAHSVDTYAKRLLDGMGLT